MHLQQMTVKENSIISNSIDHFATDYMSLLSHQPGHKFFWLSDDGHKRIPIPENKDASNIRLVTKSDIYKQVKIIHPKFDSYHRYAGSIQKLAIIQSLTLIPDMLLLVLVSKSY